MSLRRFLAATLLAVLCATPASAQLVFRNPNGTPFFLENDSPWVANDLVCATGPNDLTVGGACNALAGGTITTAHGAVQTATYLEEEVATVTSASSVSTVGTVPQGSITNRCLVRTNATVTTSGGGGYEVGVAGTADFYATTVSGTVGGTNLADDSWPGPHPNYFDTAIVITPVSGTFSNNTGRIRVVCFYLTFTAPTD